MSAAPVEREFELSDAEFERLQHLVHTQTGIALSSAKRELVYGRLARRVRKLKLSTFAEYCKILETGAPEELQELTNAITTNLTSFFREDHHFKQLAGEALREVEQRRAATRRIRIWSSACSTGEEPYSIAMVLRESFAQLASWDVKVLATDIDSKVLATAQAGDYAADRLRGISPERRERWFESTPGQPEHYCVSQALKSLITFKRLNLLDPWPMRGAFDVIFCRNVVIYFDKPTQRVLFDRMAELQEPGGWLFIGHSENLQNVTKCYRLVGRTVYRRVE